MSYLFRRSNRIGEKYYLIQFLKRRNLVNQMPNSFFDFVIEYLSKKPEHSKQLHESLLEKLERALIANFHLLEYERLKSRKRKDGTGFDFLFFDIKETMKEYVDKKSNIQSNFDNLIKAKK